MYCSGDTIRVAEQGENGLDALYGYFDVDRDGTEIPLLSCQPDDHYIDSALIAYAQSHSIPFSQDLSQRNHEDIIIAARKTLMCANPKEFKLGNLWLLLADYKRVLLKHDILKSWREHQTAMQMHPNTRFLHFTMETLRLSDLPELLLDYRHLVEAL